MDTIEIIAAIDEEIARLEEVKELLESHNAPARRGRPLGSKSKRTLSNEARAKIAAAQKKRWAQVKR